MAGRSTPKESGKSTPKVAGRSTPTVAGRSTPIEPGRSTPTVAGRSTPTVAGRSTPIEPGRSTPTVAGRSTPTVAGRSTPDMPQRPRSRINFNVKTPKKAERMQQLFLSEAAALKDAITAGKMGTHDCFITDETEDVPHIWTIRLRKRRIMHAHHGKMTQLAWGPETSRLVSVAQDGRLIVWNPFTTNSVRVVNLKNPRVMTCDYSHDGHFIASGGMDNKVSLFDLRHRGPIKPRFFEGHTATVTCIKFIDEYRMMTSSGDTTCAMWDIETGQRTNVYSGHATGVLCLSMSPDTNFFVTGAVAGCAKLWDTRLGYCADTFQYHKGDINSIAYFPGDYAFATGSEDTKCHLYDIKASTPIAVYTSKRLKTGVMSVAFSSSGRLFFGGVDDGRVFVWDSMRLKRMQILKGHKDRASCLSVARDGSALAVGSWDEYIHIWN